MDSQCLYHLLVCLCAFQNNAHCFGLGKSTCFPWLNEFEGTDREGYGTGKVFFICMSSDSEHKQVCTPRTQNVHSVRTKEFTLHHFKNLTLGKRSFEGTSVHCLRALFD